MMDCLGEGSSSGPAEQGGEHTRTPPQRRQKEKKEKTGRKMGVTRQIFNGSRIPFLPPWLHPPPNPYHCFFLLTSLAPSRAINIKHHHTCTCMPMAVDEAASPPSSIPTRARFCLFSFYTHRISYIYKFHPSHIHCTHMRPFSSSSSPYLDDERLLLRGRREGDVHDGLQHRLPVVGIHEAGNREGIDGQSACLCRGRLDHLRPAA